MSVLRRLPFVASALLLCLLTGCASRASGEYYYRNKSFEDYDISALGASHAGAVLTDIDTLIPENSEARQPQNSVSAGFERFHTATVGTYKVNIYAVPALSGSILQTLNPGEVLNVAYYAPDVLQVKLNDAVLGYCENDGLYSGLWENYYAVLPEESGMAPTSNGTLVPATSHLVDVRRYTDAFVIKMQLATNETTIGVPFYTRNLCMLQYDTLQKLLRAAELFAKDGYKIVIYDAYRPTSVQQRWFDVVKVHKWVANPAIGMGGIHDRGVAVDMSLMDASGKELDMPTAMHTLTEAAARSAAMTDVQKKNVDYMTKIMVKAGFDYIRSEWWHFQDSNIANYLPTDHPIDEIPLLYMEGGDR